MWDFLLVATHVRDTILNHFFGIQIAWAVKLSEVITLGNPSKQLESLKSVKGQNHYYSFRLKWSGIEIVTDAQRARTTSLQDRERYQL
jgi:hypothetical protein